MEFLFWGFISVLVGVGLGYSLNLFMDKKIEFLKKIF